MVCVKRKSKQKSVPVLRGNAGAAGQKPQGHMGSSVQKLVLTLKRLQYLVYILEWAVRGTKIYTAAAQLQMYWPVFLHQQPGTVCSGCLNWPETNTVSRPLMGCVQHKAIIRSREALRRHNNEANLLVHNINKTWVLH